MDTVPRATVSSKAELRRALLPRIGLGLPRRLPRAVWPPWPERAGVQPAGLSLAGNLTNWTVGVGAAGQNRFEGRVRDGALLLRLKPGLWPVVAVVRRLAK